MLTRLGKFCRKLRIDKNELLLDMAKKLGVSAAFLSSVENGKKKPPLEWKDIIINTYKLNNSQIAELEEYFFEARNQESIDISDYKESDRELMLAFARKINTMGNDKLKKINNILNG